MQKTVATQMKTCQPRFSGYRYLIGIDTGVNTGFAVWDREQKKLVIVACLMIHTAMYHIRSTATEHKIFVRVEDPRQRKFFGKTGREKLQGAGSVKRDAKMWEDFLKDIKVDYEMVAPKNNHTKVKSDYFKKLTGWKESTNEHARDAAMLVFGF